MGGDIASVRSFACQSNRSWRLVGNLRGRIECNNLACKWSWAWVSTIVVALFELGTVTVYAGVLSANDKLSSTNA